MRASHIKVGQLLKETKTKITNRQFLTSPLYRGFLADMAEATGNRYKKPIRIQLDWNSKEDADVAFTDGNVIYINSANPMTKKLPTRELKHKSLIGLLAHEVGHILFSDFDGLAAFTDAIKDGRWWPSAPIWENEIEDIAYQEIHEVFWETDEAKKKRALTLLSNIAGLVLNILEDVYIEAQMCHRFPGTYKTGIELVVGQLLENMDALSDMVDKEDVQPLSIAFSLILQYARSGDINNPDEIDNEYTEALNRCLSYIDDSVYADDVNQRYFAANKIILNLWPFIKQALKNVEDEEESGSGSKGSPCEDSDSTSDSSVTIGLAGDSDSEDDSSDSDSSGDADTALQELLEQLGKIAEKAGATAQPLGVNAPINLGPVSLLPESRGSSGADINADTGSISAVIGAADSDGMENKVQCHRR